LSVQPLLPLPRPNPVRLRSIRRAFTPSPCTGPYRLPHDVRDRLASALAPYRNRDAAFALATFLGRFWSTPARLLTAFPIDRRELADHSALGLTEARVRGAIRSLEEVGFLGRAVASGSTHKPTPDGLHRKPVLFMFGADFGPLFSAANRRAQAVRERRSGARRTPAPANPPRPSTSVLMVRPLNSPKNKDSEAEKVLMGEITTQIPRPPEPPLQNSALDAALDRWRLAFEESQSHRVAQSRHITAETAVRQNGRTKTRFERSTGRAYAAQNQGGEPYPIRRLDQLDRGRVHVAAG
jgi:hypothetical protein